MKTADRIVLTCMTMMQAMQNASVIFSLGAEKIKGIHKETVDSSQKQSEFYSELWALRQQWRIKRVGQHIIGDLSYKSGELVSGGLGRSWCS